SKLSGEPVSEVTVWVANPRLVHRTVSPAMTVISVGAKKLSLAETLDVAASDRSTGHSSANNTQARTTRTRMGPPPSRMSGRTVDRGRHLHRYRAYKYRTSCMRYLEVAEALREEIQTGRRRPGGLIDSEATLAGRYGVSRDTVRRALEHLRQDGLVASRQGFGWYVAADPVRQALGRLTTIEATLAEAGMQPSRRVVEFGPGVAPSELK